MRPDSPQVLSQSFSPTWLMTDLQFGRCVTPNSPPIILPFDLEEEIAEPRTFPTRVASDTSSSEDEATEAKRLKLDPDYVPSTASEGTLTGTNSQSVSEEEKVEEEKEETETEEEESWHPSTSTSPDVYSSPEDN
jgi:hypothetical protein